MEDVVCRQPAILGGIFMNNQTGFEVKAEHPAQKSFNIMIKNYNATIKLLIDLLSETEDEKDALMEFLERDSK